MSGYGEFSGLTITAFALAVTLSAIVSMVGAAARRLAVEEQRATARDLCELTGITDPTTLQDVFGPPDMGRVWRRVTSADIDRVRRPLGHIISGNWVNTLSVAIAGLAVIYPRPLTILALLLATGLQLAGWTIAARLPK